MNCRIKRYVVGLLILALIICIVGAQSAYAQKRRLSLATASIGGTFYIYGGGYAKIVNSKIPTIEIMVEGTPGTVANLKLLADGKVDLALAETVPSYEMLKGIGWAEGQKPFTTLRSLTPMYFAHFGMWTLAKYEDIKTSYDFQGKVVCPGPFGSGAERMSKNTFKVLGIQPIYHNMAWGESFEALGDGRIHGATGSTGHPSPAILELESRFKIRHIVIDKKDIEKILEAYPYYQTGTIPAGMYKDLDFDYFTIGTWDAVVATSALDEDIAYKITKAVFENLQTLIDTHPAAKESEPENILKQPVPIHKGALRYYREIGLEIPDYLIPPEAK